MGGRWPFPQSYFTNEVSLIQSIKRRVARQMEDRDARGGGCGGQHWGRAAWCVQLGQVDESALVIGVLVSWMSKWKGTGIIRGHRSGCTAEGKTLSRASDLIYGYSCQVHKVK